MKAETRRFENKIIRKRNRLERIGVRMAMKAIKEQIPTIRSIDSAEIQIQSLSPESIERFFIRFYGMAGKEIGMEYFKFLERKDAFLENEFLKDMEHFALTESYFRINAITETTKILLGKAVRDATKEAIEKGYGIEKTKDLIQKFMNNSIKPSRARAIAQTEIISASNAASFKAAEATGLNFKKYWSTSGLSNVRDTHLMAESDSIDGISMNQPFSNGLMFPGDPRGAASEVINCRCTVIQEPIK